MCILSPKLVEGGRHLNIELLTLSQVESIAGEAGRFTVEVREQPRHIDPDKCIACGECASVCPVQLDSEFEEGLTTRKAAFKRYPQAVPASYAIDKKGSSPCKVLCPVHISVQGYVALTAQGKYREALKLIKDENPLPAVCGRVCHHPCETGLYPRATR